MSKRATVSPRGRDEDVVTRGGRGLRNAAAQEDLRGASWVEPLSGREPHAATADDEALLAGSDVAHAPDPARTLVDDQDRGLSTIQPPTSGAS